MMMPVRFMRRHSCLYLSVGRMGLSYIGLIPVPFQASTSLLVGLWSALLCWSKVQSTRTAPALMPQNLKQRGRSKSTWAINSSAYLVPCHVRVVGRVEADTSEVRNRSAAEQVLLLYVRTSYVLRILGLRVTPNKRHEYCCCT